MFENSWFILCFVPLTPFKNSKFIRSISCEGNLLSILESSFICKYRFCVFELVSTSVCAAESLNKIEAPFVMVLSRHVCDGHLDDLDTGVCDLVLRDNL